MFGLFILIAGVLMLIFGFFPDLPFAANHRNPKAKGIWVRIAGGLIVAGYLNGYFDILPIMFLWFIIAALISLIISMFASA